MADGGPGRATDGTVPRVLAIANAQAGSADEGALGRAVATLSERTEVELARTGGYAALASALSRLDGRRLVVLGGDGSMHHALQLLHLEGALRQAGPIGLVPLGTGNDLARSLELPLDPVRAAVVALQGRARDIELLVDDRNQVVVNTVHAGIGAEAAARAGRFKPLLGRAAYPLGALMAAARGEPGWRLRVEVDGEVVADGDRPVLMVGVGLGGTIGGGADLVPDADPHDGIADVVVAAPVGTRARVTFARELRDGVHVQRRDVTTARGHVVSVASVDGRTFRTNADGEVTGPWTAKRWRTLDAAWQVVVPR